MVPRQFQILWVNGVAFVWTILLTYISHGGAKKVEDAASKVEDAASKAKKTLKKKARQH